MFQTNFIPSYCRPARETREREIDAFDSEIGLTFLQQFFSETKM